MIQDSSMAHFPQVSKKEYIIAFKWRKGIVLSLYRVWLKLTYTEHPEAI